MIDILTGIAMDNKGTASLKGLRLKNGFAMTTNTLTSMRVENLPFTGIDAYVDASAFNAAWMATKAPKVSQTARTVLIEEGRFKADIVQLDTDSFAFDPAKKPEGQSYEPKDLLDAIDRLAPYMKIKAKKQEARTYAMGRYLYCTNGNFVMRTKIDFEFPRLPDRAVVISAQLADILKKIKKPAIALYLDSTSISLTFDNCWIETVLDGEEEPESLEGFFSDFADTTFTPFPDDVLGQLKHMVSFAGQDDLIQFSSMGISLFQDRKVSWNVNYSMPMFSIKAPALATIIGVAQEFNFDTPNLIKFKSVGNGIEGVWSTRPSEE